MTGRGKQTPRMRKRGASRRQVLSNLAATGLAASLAKPALAAASGRDAALREAIRNVVVIYAENRSFNNLFSSFPGLKHPLSEVDPERLIQRDRDGNVLASLPPIWGGLIPTEQTLDGRRYQVGETAITGLANGPFALKTPEGELLPHGLVTRDLAHLFYHNQMQINGGRNDGFVAWGDSGALVMGHYGDTPTDLRLARIARRYTLCDNFFMGAFGGSFLNHQYLAAARPPFYPDADKGAAARLIAVLEGDDPAGNRLKPLPQSPASALQGPPRFSPNNLTPDFYAVNTMLPPYPPGVRDQSSPLWLPPQEHKTIGDVLSEKGIEWAWYAGAWQAAMDGNASNGKDFPPRPNFQVHHQPLNYFRNFAPGTEQRARLRDGGLGSTPDTNKFMADARDGKLPQVAFYKPEGDLNMHAGYSAIADGDRHIAEVIETLRAGPQWKNMLIVMTFDENGGWWDHVAPPRGDRWGPGSRIPAILVSPHVREGHVEHTVYDTGSILRFLTRRFGLEKLSGLQLREDEMRRNEGFAPGDLTEALTI
ncbi:MAG: acid phosphatase [Alphaproteobacteria bacterium]|nr:acid phosphatase [Alphaproteobacteria bacterium]